MIGAVLSWKPQIFGSSYSFSLCAVWESVAAMKRRALSRSLLFFRVPFESKLLPAVLLLLSWDPADQLQESKTAPARKVKKESPGESPRRPGRCPKKSQK